MDKNTGKQCEEVHLKQKVYYSLSHAQKRIWYTERMYPSTGFANLAGSVLFEYPKVDFKLLSQAINMVISKYDALRIHLVEAGDCDVKQYISAYTERTFDILKGSDVNTLAVYQSTVPFTLINGDLFYFALIHPTDHQWGYYFKYHHILCDAMSVTLINKEIHTFYKKLANHEDVLLKRDTPSFLEYLQRDQAYLSSLQYYQDEAFWLNEFKDLPPPLKLKSNSSLKTITASRKVHNLGRTLTAAIYDFCKRNETTLFRFFMSVFYVYFMRITSTVDMIIATGHHNRLDKREKEMVGMTVSTLPIRITANENMDFISLLKYVTRKTAESLAHQAYPFDLLALHLRERGFDPHNLLSIALNHIPSLTEDYMVERYSPGFDPALINIKMNPNQLPKDAPLEIAIDFREGLFEKEEIKRLFQHLETLICDIIQNPEKKLYRLNILPNDEKKRILTEFNNTAIATPKESFIHLAFTEQAMKTPHNIALVYKNKSCTYRELDIKTNQLARLLREKGVKPGTIAAVMVERSEDVVLGALSVFKAGGTYLPLDPGFPEERIRFILDETQAEILLTQQALKEKTAFYQGERLYLEDPGLYSGDDTGLKNMNTSSDPAYIIYTSGSSGKPKGVLVEHRNLSNFCGWYINHYQLTGKDAQAAYCSFIFDVSIADLLPPLMKGAALHILPEEIRLSPEEINSYYEKHHITLAFLPTKVGEVFMETTDNRSLRILTVAGEKLNCCNLGRYSLINAYGPTEATVFATTFPVVKEYTNIPIGKPIFNTKAYVVDKYGNLLPLGIPGELWLSGLQIARGYLKREELTREKFIENPFATREDDKRVYKTGDLVRWLPDGNLEFLGRLDTQVKIRGFRIEPAEIEQYIIKYPEISEAVVLDCTDPLGNMFLCAYLETSTEFSKESLKKYLRLHLPDYMVPLHFVRVPAIPLTRNGKTDPNALRELTKGFKVEKKDGQPLPKTPTEQKLSQIWKELLGVSQVSITQSFFELGGNSLLSMKLFIRIKETFGLNLPVSIIFKENTIEKLSEIIDDNKGSHIPRLIPIREGNHKHPLFCIHDYSGEVLSYSNLASSMKGDQPMYGIRYTYTEENCGVSVEALAEDYIKEIRSIQPQGPYYLVGYSSGGTIAYEMALQLLLQNEEVGLLALLDTPNYSLYPSLMIRLYFKAVEYFLACLKVFSFKYKGIFFSKNLQTSCAQKIGQILASYDPKPYPGRLTLFKTRIRIMPTDKKLGWGQLVKELDLYQVGGHHLSIIDKKISARIAHCIKNSLGNGVQT
ncbi:MAG: amino acid adenylation domain-containing protein [Clostridia bacterium]|nr:amino acid adenylation domain-containing protein [Clostridia bacterium]